MSIEDILAGIRPADAVAREAAEAGADLIGTGDMGIGNTTASSAITAALTGRPPRETTGRGTGRDDQELARKAAVVERALAVNQPDAGDGLDVLARVGGFEIGVLAGVVLGGALARRVVVLDGFISGAAALIAHSLCPTVTDYLVASHLSATRWGWGSCRRARWVAPTRTNSGAPTRSWRRRRRTCISWSRACRST